MPQKQKKRTQRRSARGEDPADGGQDQGPAPSQQRRQADEGEPNHIGGNEAHMARRDEYLDMGMNHDAEAPGHVNRQLEDAEPAASGLFNWLASPAASLGSPSLFASPHKIPLFQRSPRGHGPPGSPTNQFSVNSFANIFQSPLRTPMGDALHAALGNRFDTPCSAQFADSLFSPSPRRSSRLAASGRGAATDGLYGDMAVWDMGSGGQQQARAGGSGAGGAVMDALADAQHDDGADLLQKLLRSPAAMDASDRPNTRSRGGAAGPSRLGGGSLSRRRCLDFSRTDGPASLPLTRSSTPSAGAAGHGQSGTAAADPFLRSAAPAGAAEQAVGQFITIPVPGGAPVPVGVEGVQAATLLPLQPLWGTALQLQQGGQGEQSEQQLEMLMVPQSEVAAAMQLFMPVAGMGAGDDAGAEQPMSMQALLNGPSPTEGRARSRGRALRKLIEEGDEQQQQQEEQEEEEAGELDAPGSGASDVRRSTRRTRRGTATAAAAAPAAPTAPKGVQASIVQQAVANTPAGRRRQAAAAQAGVSGGEAAGTGSADQQQRSSPAEQSALLSSEAHGLLPPDYRLQLLSGDSQASVIPPMTPDELQRQREQVAVRTCHCKKSRCLKLYCECFANGMFCTNCSCVDCQNTKVNANEVMTRRQSIKQRDPGAFEHKLRSNNSSRKGCNCRKSHCLKKYCECFQLGVRCGDLCKCIDCKNNEMEGSTLQEPGSRQQHTIGWHVPPGTSVGTPPMVHSMSRTMSESMGTPQTHNTVGVGPMLMRLPHTPASNGPLVLLSLSSPLDPATAAALARQHPQLAPHNTTPLTHPSDMHNANHTPNSGRRGALAAAQLGLTANAVQQQLLAAAPKLQQQLQQQGMEHGSGSPSHGGGSMDGTASGGPATTSAPVALRTRHRLSTVSSHSTAVKAEPGMEANGEAGHMGSQGHTPRGGRLQHLQQQQQQHAEPDHGHETDGDAERRSRSRSMSRASTPTSSQLMPPPPRQQIPQLHNNIQTASAVAVMSPAAVSGGERIIRLGVDGPLLKLPAAALNAAPAVQLLGGGAAGVNQGQQQQQERDQGDANSQVGVLIYLQDDAGKVSAYYVPTAPSQDGQPAVGACLPSGIALMQTAAVPVAMDRSFSGLPEHLQQQQQQQQQQQYDQQYDQQQYMQHQQQQDQQQRHGVKHEDVVVDLEADESLQDSEDMHPVSPPRRVTRHTAAAAAASVKAGPVKRSTPTKRKAAGAGSDQDVQREQDTLRASPLKFARSPNAANGLVRTQLFRGMGPPASPTGMLLRNKVLTKDDSPPGVADAMSPTKFLASPSSGRGSTMIRFSPGSTLLSPSSKGSRR